MARVLPALGPVCSAPALAAILRACSPAETEPILRRARLNLQQLTPMYRVTPANPLAEATAATRLVSEVANRLQRLAHAYGAWSPFEPAPYFDLPPAPAVRLVRVVERVHTVYVVFFVDALLPTFQDLVTTLGLAAAPAGIPDEIGVQQQIGEQWRRLVLVLTQARQLLADNVAFLATNGANEERQRWAGWWQLPPQAGLPARLGASLPAAPTLTLSIEFPLPIVRQPDRLRRLRRTWERQQGTHHRRRASK